MTLKCTIVHCTEKAKVIANVFKNSNKTTINMTSKAEFKVMVRKQWLNSQIILNNTDLTTKIKMKRLQKKTQNMPELSSITYLP